MPRLEPGAAASIDSLSSAGHYSEAAARAIEGSAEHDSEPEPVAFINCDKAFLCRSNDYCTCFEDGCTATDSSSRLTVRRVGDELVVFHEAHSLARHSA